MKNLETLKQEFLLANQEYQFALASGDMPRLKKAIQAFNTTFAAYNKAKKKEFLAQEKRNNNKKPANNDRRRN